MDDEMTPTTAPSCVCNCHNEHQAMQCTDCASKHTVDGTKDGSGAGDHDEPYRYVRPTTHWPTPFTPWQFARLLIAKAKFSERGEMDRP